MTVIFFGSLRRNSNWKQKIQTYTKLKSAVTSLEKKLVKLSKQRTDAGNTWTKDGFCEGE